VITKVACTDKECANYGKAVSVAVMMLNGQDQKVCVVCGAKTKVVEQSNASGTGRRERRPRPRSTGRS
jgi:hypothetical protein